MSNIDDLLATEAEAAERHDTPDEDQGQRRNLNRSVMFSIRLDPDELAELQRHAEHYGLPARTLARAWILDRLRADDPSDLTHRVYRLEQAVFQAEGAV